MAGDVRKVAGAEYKSRIFISYSRSDLAFADQLEAALKARGFEPLIDRTEIYAFEDWWKRIEALISQADTVVFILSPDLVVSEVALKEVACAAELHKRFAPIVCRRVADAATPEALRRLNFIFFDDPTRFEANAGQLAEALKTDIGWIRQHTAFGEAARRWAAAGQPNGLLLHSPILEEAENWLATRPYEAPEPTEETQAFVRRSRQATTRRRNIFTSSLAIGLVLALGLAGLAYWQRGNAIEQHRLANEQRQIAEQQRKRAEDTLAAATNTANDLVFDLAQKFRDMTGISIVLIKDILDRARHLQEQLTQLGQVTPELRRSQVLALNEISTTLLDAGDTKGALEAAERARQIIQDLVGSNANNSDWQRDLSIAYENVGDAQKAQGDLPSALKSYQASLLIRERLANGEPGIARWQRDLSIAYEHIGDVQRAQGDLAAALKSDRANLAIRERLTQFAPGDAELLRELSVAYAKVGDAQIAQDDLPGALKSYQASLVVAEHLAGSNPGNAGWQRDLMVAYGSIGDVQKAQGDLTAALKSYQLSLAINEKLAMSDPGNAVWQRDLSVSYENVGDVQLAKGDPSAALKSYQASLAVAERLITRDPHNFDWQRDLSVAYNKVGDLQLGHADFAAALKSYQASLAIRERLAKDDPSNANWQRDLSVSYERIGIVQQAQSDLGAALKPYQASLAIRERLISLDRSNGQWRADFLFTIGRIGGLVYRLVLARDFALALHAADQAIAGAPDEIWLYKNQAHALMFLGRLDEARVIYLKYRGQNIMQSRRTWETFVLADFAELKNAGLTNALMDEVEKLFASAR